MMSTSRTILDDKEERRAEKEEARERRERRERLEEERRDERDRVAEERRFAHERNQAMLQLAIVKALGLFDCESKSVMQVSFQEIM